MSPERTDSLADVRQSLKSFADALESANPMTEFSLWHPEYFVYDPAADAFGPAKWVAFKGMTPDIYHALQQQQRNGAAPGFDGTNAHEHLAKLLKLSFGPDSELSTRLRDRFVRAFGEGKLGNRSFDELKFITLPESQVRFWWVNQSDTFEEASEKGAIWASINRKGGGSDFHHDNVAKVAVGDVIFSYCRGQITAISRATEAGHKATEAELAAIERQGKELWIAKLNYQVLKKPVDIERINKSIRSLRITRSPIDKTGGVNQGYLYELDPPAAKVIIDEVDPSERPEGLMQSTDLPSTTAPTRPQKYWKFAPGDGAKYWPELNAAGLIAVGYEEVPDLRQFGSTAALEKALRRSYPDQTDRQIAHRVRELGLLLNDIAPGDIIVANRGLSSMVGRGEVVGGYSYNRARKVYPHTLPVRWFDTVEKSIPDQGTGWMKTIVELSKDEYDKLVQGAKSPKPTTALPDVYESLSKKGLRFPTELVTTYLLSLKTKGFVILSGISGTGKTKLAQGVAEWAGTDYREEVTNLPSALSGSVGSGRWVYELQPYNFVHRRIVVAKEFQQFLNLPKEGSVPIEVLYDGKKWRVGLGTWNKGDRALYQLLLGKELTERLSQQFAAKDFIAISVDDSVDTPQTLRLERVESYASHAVVLDRRYEFISVRPDWLDGREMLGFYNILTEEYVTRPFLRLCLRAHAEPEKPFFVILDEMNLARVEHYFADLLSATESRQQGQSGTVVQEPVHLHDLPQCIPINPPDGWTRPPACGTCRATREEVAKCKLQFGAVQMIPPAFPVPTNVHVTGTVNVDETTHMFSPKVLDRGNVIEFNRVELGEEASSLESSFKLRDSSLVLGQASIATLQDYRSAPGEFQQAIAGLQAILEPFNLHFGYRVANEMAAYVHNAIKCVGPKSTSDAIDLQILQKVLPKLHGTKQRLTTPLWRLLLFCVNGASELSAEFDEELFKSVEGQVLEGAAPETPGVPKATAAKFPRASRKIVKMLRTLRAQGFVSFVE